jgi:hypothetical protein
MRMRPASFTAAAPPSSFQVAHSVIAMDTIATSKKLTPSASSLVVRVAGERMAAV